MSETRYMRVSDAYLQVFGVAPSVPKITRNIRKGLNVVRVSNAYMTTPEDVSRFEIEDAKSRVNQLRIAKRSNSSK